jgi:hypothetical protein
MESDGSSELICFAILILKSIRGSGMNEVVSDNAAHVAAVQIVPETAPIQSPMIVMLGK